jgi:hypothetical protein
MASTRDSTASVLQIDVRWGETVLRVEQVSPPRGIAIGDRRHGAVFFDLPEEILGCPRLEIVTIEPDGPWVHDRHRASPLTRGAPVVVRVGDFEIGIVLVDRADRPARARLLPDFAARCALLCAAIVHLVLLCAFRATPPDLLDRDDAPLDRSARARLLSAETNRADRELSVPSPKNEYAEDEAGGAVERGARHRGAEGALGERTHAAVDHRFRLARSDHARPPALGRVRTEIEEGRYGALAVLAGISFASSRPIVAFDATVDEPSGLHRRTHLGRMIGEVDGDAFGYGALGVAFADVAGGGRDVGVGLDSFGFSGPGGGGTCECDGIGLGRYGTLGRVGRTSERGERRVHRTGVARPLERETEVVGRLPPRVVDRIVRANAPRLRACYDAGLRRDPSLRGTMRVRFVVDGTGAVESASSSGGTLRDAPVERCVVAVFATLSFPAPAGGKAFVTRAVDFDGLR